MEPSSSQASQFSSTWIPKGLTVARGFSAACAAPAPTYNFETDIEFLQTLPLVDGYEAHINFYHPGGKQAPQRYTFRVAGSETIAGAAAPVECWIVTTDYNRPGPVSKFWFAKATQLMVRQESVAGDKVLVKTLID